MMAINETSSTEPSDTSGKKMMSVPIYPEEEKPLIVIRLKFGLWIFMIISLLWLLWFFSFGTIVPYMTTGDLSEIWPAHNGGSIIIKFIFFMASWIFWLYSASLVQGFRTGDVTFYGTYVEVKPYLGFFKKRAVSYDVMHVKQRGDRGMVLTNGRAPEWRENPFNYWKTIYWDGIGVTMISMGLHNPECLEPALQIIRERAKTITKL